MKLSFQGDALFGPCPEGGDLDFIDGEPVRSGGLSGAVYIAMMGGNHFDDGSPASKLQWWGNALDSDPTAHIRGRTSTLLATLPATSGNLRRIEAATVNDLQWMLDTGVANEITVAASLEAVRFVVIEVTVTANDQTETFRYRENWTAGSFEPALSCT